MTVLKIQVFTYLILWVIPLDNEKNVNYNAKWMSTVGTDWEFILNLN